jgi:GNAT superfamily N-acetyltransferase
MGAPYRIDLVSEAALPDAVRTRLGELLTASFEEGNAYRGTAWRKLAPVFRVLATAADGDVVGQASGIAIGTRPDIGLFGLGDVAVDRRHRGHGLARALCTLFTEEARRRGAGVAMARTTRLRSVLARLGYVPVTGFDYYFEEHGACVRFPDWMALVWRPHESPVCLEEGDF